MDTILAQATSRSDVQWNIENNFSSNYAVKDNIKQNG